MTATIHNLNDYRRVPSVIEQRERIEWLARQQVMFDYGGEPTQIVELACDEDGHVAREGGGLGACMEAAQVVIEKYWEYKRKDEKGELWVVTK